MNWGHLARHIHRDRDNVPCRRSFGSRDAGLIDRAIRSARVRSRFGRLGAPYRVRCREGAFEALIELTMHFLVSLLRLLRVRSVLIGRRRIELLSHDGSSSGSAGNAFMGVAFRDASGTDVVRSAWCRGSTPGGPRMATKKDGQIVETPTEARQAEPGPSILLVLNVSVALAAILLSVVWFIFFRT